MHNEEAKLLLSAAIYSSKKMNKNVFSTGAPLQTPMGNLVLPKPPLAGLLDLFLREAEEELTFKGQQRRGEREKTYLVPALKIHQNMLCVGALILNYLLV